MVGDSEEFFVGGGEVSVIVEVADDEFSGRGDFGADNHGSDLPCEMVGERGRRAEEVLEGWLVGVFVFYGGAETGLEIVTEIGAEVDLVERIFGFSGCGLRRERLNFLRGFALTIYVIEDGD